MAFPGAQILLFDGDQLTPTPYDELDHVRLTRAFLNDPESYLRRL
jgi:predicted ATPase